MNDADLIREIVRAIQQKAELFTMHRGVIVSVSEPNGTALVNYAGSDVDMPYYSHLTLEDGDIVDVLVSGGASRILGVIA